ncbi:MULTISPECIES: 50S ribosomal protein L25/general stress protein Ctc [Gammaproteobacteria]|uniref:50S ribosomal protein L25/general stress protein Ctc n=1 Tax=Gammaproteobacteria TaxID=1236 RepID=UPI000DD01D57|nr:MULTISPECIES: 50S ribosomal protein L25/general stress protein Ctc [Gammaproteobacteria]RTE87434.1 50S ribosomal protein L25/general stress protein Ctc [Aliidiomarina sp. B3213]TCZ92781.1 50S ribosomal protein L25/general stress protein Ctc [Lysobacter sp. N42]
MSSPTYEFNAELRSDMGKGASRRLRREGKVPAILYGGNKDAVSITLDHDKVNNAADHEGFYSHILTLTIDGKKHQAILKDIQRHPYKPKLTHLDFQRVSAKEELHTNIPLHFLNEESVKKAGGVVVHNLNDVEISCLPKDLPEYLEIDLDGMEIGDNVHLTDLKLPKGVTLLELTRGEDHDQVVVTIAAPKVEAETDEDADESSEASDAASDSSADEDKSE